MERAKADPEALKWKKQGGGPLHINIGGRVQIIKPGQEFMAKEEEIPVTFRDVIVPVNPVVAAKKKQEVEEKAAEAAKPKYFLKEKGGNWWDVVNADGKVQNEKSLRKADAEKLIEDLS